jgi:hypothetical protein
MASGEASWSCLKEYALRLGIPTIVTCANVDRSGANSHDFAPLCIHWNGKVAAAQPHRQRATDYHGCARITVR